MYLDISNTPWKQHYKVLPDDAFRVACVDTVQAAAAVQSTGWRGAKLVHLGTTADGAAAELTYLCSHGVRKEKRHKQQHSQSFFPNQNKTTTTTSSLSTIYPEYSYNPSLTQVLPAAQWVGNLSKNTRWRLKTAVEVSAGCFQLSFLSTGVIWSHCYRHVTGSCSYTFILESN